MPKRKIHLTRRDDHTLSLCSRPIRRLDRRANYRKTFNQISKEERCSDCDSIANGAPHRAYRYATMQAPTTASRSTPDTDISDTSANQGCGSD